MIRIKPTEDIQPLTAFRANVAGFIDQVREQHRPLVLTQHGKSAAVLLGAEDYEDLVEELELHRSVQRGLDDAAEGRVVSHDVVAAELRGIVQSRGDG